MIPFSVIPPATRSRALLPETVRSPLRVTPPVKVPAALSSDSSSVAPSANATVPPFTVPRKFQEPVLAFKVRVAPVLFTVPVRLTTPPVRLMVPSPAVVTAPPRFSVELTTLMAPLLLQLPPSVRVESVAEAMPALVMAMLVATTVPPFVAWIVPALVKMLLGPTVRLCAAMLALIRPLLARLLVPPVSHCSPTEA